MLDLAILGLLGEKDRHGYEIRRLLRDELGLVTTVSFGSLYPALARLERSGAVEVVAVDETSVPTSPSTGSLSGERAAARGLRTGLARGLRPPRTTRAASGCASRSRATSPRARDSSSWSDAAASSSAA